MDSTGGIRLEQLTKRYGLRAVVSNVTLDVGPTEFRVMIGNAVYVGTTPASATPGQDWAYLDIPFGISAPGVYRLSVESMIWTPRNVG